VPGLFVIYVSFVHMRRNWSALQATRCFLSILPPTLCF